MMPSPLPRIVYTVLLSLCWVGLGWAQDAPPKDASPLKVGTKQFKPFVSYTGADLKRELQKGGSSALQEPPEGFSIELWDAIARKLGREYTWVGYGPNIVDLTDAVAAGEVDVAIAGISITASRERQYDFSHEMFKAGLQVMVSEKKDGGPLDLLWRSGPAVLQIITGGFVVVLCLACLFWLAERNHNEDIPQGPRGIVESMWWAMVTITTVGYGDIAPRTFFGRMLAVLWMTVTLFMLTGFVAAVSSAMTVDRLQQRISGPDDLDGHRVATVEGTTAASYLETRRLRKLVESPNIDEAIAALEAGEVEAVVFDAPALLYYASHEGQGKVTMVGPVFQRQGYGIAFPSGSPLRDAVNQALLELREEGTFGKLYEKYFGREEG